MKKYIYPSDGYSPPDIVEAEPQCGDYCDICGACLKCDWEAPCIDADIHFWATDEESEAKDTTP